MKLLKTLRLAACFSFLACQPCLAQTAEQDERWVHEHFSEVLRKALPNDEGAGWRVGFTINRDLYTEVLEYSCIFKESWPESPQADLVVVVRMADSKSIYDQLMTLHREHPAASVEQIRSKLRIKEWQLTEKSCPAARERYSAFYQLNLPVLSAKDRASFARGRIDIILHPLIYNLHAVISGGDVELSLAGKEHPFVKWADRTRAQLDACIKNTNKQNEK
jgi:hypothetical protein